MTEQRHDAIRTMEKGSFQGAHGHTDFATLKLAVYEKANSLNILPLIVIDMDLATMGQQVRQDPLLRPGPLNNAPTGAQSSLHRSQMDAWTMENKALSDLKELVVQMLDGTAKKVVSQPGMGTLLRTTPDIITMLHTQYHLMSNEALSAIKMEWQQMRWDQSEDLVAWLSKFSDPLLFLEDHNYLPPMGEQVTTLLRAIDHVPTLAAPTKAAFYQAVPAVAQQTLDTLKAHMTTVYRTQYVHTTATEHHAVNQARADTTDPNDLIIKGIAASARATLRGADVTPDQLERMQAAVTRAIKQSLNPLPSAPNQARGRGRDDAPLTKPKKGECPLHRGAYHEWAKCGSNPDRK